MRCFRHVRCRSHLQTRESAVRHPAGSQDPPGPPAGNQRMQRLQTVAADTSRPQARASTVRDACDDGPGPTARTGIGGSAQTPKGASCGPSRRLESVVVRLAAHGPRPVSPARSRIGVTTSVPRPASSRPTPQTRESAADHLLLAYLQADCPPVRESADYRPPLRQRGRVRPAGTAISGRELTSPRLTRGRILPSCPQVRESAAPRRADPHRLVVAIAARAQRCGHAPPACCPPRCSPRVWESVGELAAGQGTAQVHPARLSYGVSNGGPLQAVDPCVLHMALAQAREAAEGAGRRESA